MKNTFTLAVGLSLANLSLVNTSECQKDDPIESIKWYTNSNCDVELTKYNAGDYIPYGRESFYNNAHSKNNHCHSAGSTSKSVTCTRDVLTYKFFTRRDCRDNLLSTEVYDINKCTGYYIKESLSNSGRPEINKAGGGQVPNAYLMIKALMLPVKETTKVAETKTATSSSANGDS